MSDINSRILKNLEDLIKILLNIKHNRDNFKEDKLNSLNHFRQLSLKFYDIGIADEGRYVREPLEDIEQDVNFKFKEIAELITEQSNWLKKNIRYFARFRINFLSDISDCDILEIRSGLEFLCVDFKNIQADFDVVIKNIKRILLEEFDEILQVWMKSGIGYRKNSDKIPGSHWWWNQ